MVNKDGYHHVHVWFWHWLAFELVKETSLGQLQVVHSHTLTRMSCFINIVVCLEPCLPRNLHKFSKKAYHTLWLLDMYQSLSHLTILCQRFQHWKGKLSQVMVSYKQFSLIIRYREGIIVLVGNGFYEKGLSQEWQRDMGAKLDRSTDWILNASPHLCLTVGWIEQTSLSATSMHWHCWF